MNPHSNPASANSVLRLLRALQTAPRFASNITAVHELPASSARFGPWPRSVAFAVRAAAASMGIERLYVHQSEAIALTAAGENVVVATGTASGKSLCYQVPALDAIQRRPASRVLMVFPTKALARDQLAALDAWEDSLSGLRLDASAYDGDTAPAARGAIRRQARIVATNPDMLHQGILPHHARWSSFLANLELVVIDEMHVYRGVFGSHVANVLRRLRRVCRFHGSDPLFVLTSATIANPRQLARDLIGSPVHVVSDDGSPRGKQTFLFYNPPVVDERLNLRRSSLLEADALARHFVGGGVQTIVFARSRQATELMVRYISDGLGRAAPGDSSHVRESSHEADAGSSEADDAAPAANASAPRAAVRGYRGGYRPSERREIESLLRQGDLRCVVATNALELGIDIGQLDACVMAGYPGTIASTWQQSGRAGRRTSDSVAVLVASSSPLDQFIARNPRYLLGRSPEHARIDADNLVILLDHVRCAAFELPFSDDEAGEPFGCRPAGLLPPGKENAGVGTAGDVATPPPPTTAELLAVLEAEGSVSHSRGTWFWLSESYPAAAVGLRSAGPEAVTVVVEHPHGSGGASPGEARAEALGTVERATAQIYLHPGAIYMHDGLTYRVRALDWDAGRAIVHPTEPASYTRAVSRVDVRPLRVDAERSAPGATVGCGEVEVTARVTGFREIRFHTHETLGWGQLDLPERRLRTGAYWFTLDDDTVESLRSIGRWREEDSTARGPNWSRQRDMARQRDGYRCRVCNVPERPGRQHDVHHIRPFAEFGYQRGANDAYLNANDLDNLITLCPRCHRLAERVLGLHGGLSGVGYALRHVSALHLMCDHRDIDVATTTHAPWSGRPTVVIHESVAAGVGFGSTLYQLHEEIVADAAALIEGCPCSHGCPSCVGPVVEHGRDDKAHALTVLQAIVA